MRRDDKSDFRYLTEFSGPKMNNPSRSPCVHYYPPTARPKRGFRWTVVPATLLAALAVLPLLAALIGISAKIEFVNGPNYGGQSVASIMIPNAFLVVGYFASSILLATSSRAVLDERFARTFRLMIASIALVPLSFFFAFLTV